MQARTLISILSGAATAALSTNALAQQSSSEGAAQQINPQGTAENADSGEIIVTAQKRAERIRNVPISISVVTGKDIKERGLVSAEDYLRGMPGVSQVGEKGGAAIVIRGLETSPTAQNFSTGPTVAVYFGETPITTSAGISGGSNVDVKLVDINRVEVLRGPQGTSFGNASLGGAVRIIPNRPLLDKQEVRAEASYSNTENEGSDNYSIQGTVNVPLIAGKIALRGSLYQFSESGFYRNTAATDPDLQAAAVHFGAEEFAKNERHVGASLFTGGRASLLISPQDDLQLTLSYLAQKTEINGQPLSNRPDGYLQAIFEVAPEHTVRGRRDSTSDTAIHIANATLEYDLKWSDLVATYSRIDSGSTWVNPYSSLSFLPWPASIYIDNDHKEDSGEIRLASKLNLPVQFIAGAYAENLRDIYDSNTIWYGDPATAIFPTGPDGRDWGKYGERRKSSQAALFGELSWEPIERLKLTGGARYYHYKRHGRVDSTAPGGITTTTTTSGKASGTSFRGNISYKPTDTSLVYASFSQGFRLGKPQQILPAQQCDLDSDGIIDGTDVPLSVTGLTKSDSVNNYEVGGKLSLLNKRVQLSADGFRLDWKNVPVRVGAGTCGLAYNAFVGAARSKGIEVEMQIRATNQLNFYLSGSMINAKLTEDAPDIGASAGDRLPGAPKWNAGIGAQYEFLAGTKPVNLRVDSIYVGKFRTAISDPEPITGGYIKVDASANIRLNRFTLGVFGNNLTDRHDITFGSVGTPFSTVGIYRLRPRTIGVRLGAEF